jgi:hypothetical protein
MSMTNICCLEPDEEIEFNSLIEGAELVFDYSYDEGYGHHSVDEVWRLADGRYVHAECGGCSCEGSGSFSVEKDEETAMRLVPEYHRK